MIKQIVECTTNKSLMTIFRFGESSREDLDHAIMSCLLKGRNLSPPEQLNWLSPGIEPTLPEPKSLQTEQNGRLKICIMQ